MFKKNTLHAVEAISLLMLAIIAAWYFPNVQGSQDTGIYARIGSDVWSGVAIESEYPPLMTAIFALVARGTAIFTDFHAAWLLFLLWVTGFTSLALAMFSKAKPVVTLVMLSTFIIGPELLLARFDVLVFLSLLLCLHFQEQKRPLVSGFMLGIAGSIKIVPLLLLPGLFAVNDRKDWLKIIGGLVMGVICAALFAFFIIGPVGFVENSTYLMNYHTGRGIQMESTWSSIDLFLRQLFYEPAVMEFRAMSAVNASLGNGTVMIATFMVLSGVFWIALRSFQTKKVESFVSISALTLLWTIGVSPILSPQYFVWVLPIIGYLLYKTWPPSDAQKKNWYTALALTLGIAVITQWIFPHNYSGVLDQSSMLVLTALLIRNIALFALIWSIVKLEHFKVLPDANVKPDPHFDWKLPIAFLISVLFIITSIHQAVQPTFHEARYRFGGGEEQTGPLPVAEESNGDTIDVETTIDLPGIHPTVFTIIADDCLETLEVNKQVVEVDSSIFCNFAKGGSMDLKDYLHTGENTLFFHIRDDGGMGGLQLSVSRADPLLLGILGALIAIVVTMGFILLKSPYISERPYLWWVFIAGVVLLILYVSGTPHSVRGHDTDAHIDYIHYVAENFDIPLAESGWEMHQAPMYYFIVGVWDWLMRFAGRADFLILEDIQIFSGIVSVITLLASYIIARLLFKKGDGNAVLFLSFVVGFPTLAFVAARISNDPLYTALVFTGFMLLMLFWQNQSLKTWYWLVPVMVFIGLTKMSGYPIMALCFLCLLLAWKIPLKKRIMHIAISAVLVIVFFGWLPVYRLMEPDPTRTIRMGNHGTNDGLMVENKTSTYTTFDPMEMMLTPYNNPWEDESRRQYFWEYFFRSALTGEWGFPDSVRWTNLIMLFSAIMLLPLGFWGLIHTLWKEPIRMFPLWAAFGLLLLSSVMYRLQYAYGSNQDFRFVLLMVVPIGYFLVRGTEFPSKLWTRIARIPLVSFIASSVIFLVILVLEGIS